MKKIVHGGFLYSLHIENQFIEYFDTQESAKAYVEDVTATCHFANYFIKPVAYYSMKEENP